MTSPYHQHRATALSPWMSPIAQPLLQKLLSLPPTTLISSPKKSLPFVEVADALDVITTEASHNRATQTKVLQLLFERALDVALQESAENAVLETYLLLRMLIPSEDHENVYGIKTYRLVKLSSALLKQKLGRSDAAAQLEKWLTDPAPQYSHLKKNQQGIVCLPEVVISTLISTAARPQASSCNYTVQDVAVLCARMTEAYLTAPTQTPGIDTLQMEVLYEASQHFSFQEWVLFLRILLKKVSVGVGPKTVLNCMPHLMASVLYQRQHDLANLALASVKHGSDPTEVWKRQPTPIICGIPVVPMTCETLKSPFLFTQLFSKENKLRKPISPKDGRLVVVQSRGWYIPMIHNAKQKTYVSIEDDSSLRSKSRRKHVILLREFKKHGFINESACSGLVLHYTLSAENNDAIVLLIRFASDAKEQSIELMDGTLIGERVSSSCPEKIGDDSKKLPEPAIHACEPHLLEDPTWIQSAIIHHSKQDSLSPATESKEFENGVAVTLNNKIMKLFVASNCESKQKKKKNTPLQKKIDESEALPGSNPPMSSSRIPLLARKNKIKPSPSSTPMKKAVQPTIKNTAKEEVVEDESEQNKILVQVKYDGDRLQAHIQKNKTKEPSPQQEQLLDVKLYTKWGKDVSELYSNVRDSLQSNTKLTDCAPCILDGELIIVDTSTETPLPWTNEKWKYNQGIKLSQSSPTIMSANDGNHSDVVSIVYDIDVNEQRSGEEASVVGEGRDTMTLSTINNHKDDEETEDPLAFASLKDLKKWSGLGPIDRDNMYVRPIASARLQYVIFDIILHQDKPVHELPCVKRYELLNSVYQNKVFSPQNATVIVIPQTQMINQTPELINALKVTVEKKQEGLVLKDPQSPYEFGKSKNVQKLKIGGPDINACVLGIGFSYSTSPRKWGLLSCIASVNSDTAWSSSLFICYTRVEVIEGCSEPWRAFEHVYKLKSRLKVSDAIKNSKPSITNETYDILILKKNGIIEIEWLAKSDQWRHLNCRVVLKKQNLTDIQWLCNPLECGFRMSLRGELWPIPKSNDLEENPLQLPLLYPRHPIARLELNGHQSSVTCDTSEVIQRKFEASRNVSECIDNWFKQTVSRLRPIVPPPINDSKLQLLRQIMIGYEGALQQTPASDARPKAVISLEEFSSLLESFKTKFPLFAKLFYPLTPEEKLIMMKIPSTHTLWTLMEQQTQPRNKNTEENTPTISDENETMEEAEKIAQFQKLMARFKELNTKIKKPVVKGSKSFTLVAPALVKEEGEETTMLFGGSAACTVGSSFSYSSSSSEDDEDT